MQTPQATDNAVQRLRRILKVANDRVEIETQHEADLANLIRTTTQLGPLPPSTLATIEQKLRSSRRDIHSLCKLILHTQAKLNSHRR